MIFYELEYITEEKPEQVLKDAFPDAENKKSEIMQALNANIFAELPLESTMVCTGTGEAGFSLVLATDLWEEGKAKVVKTIKGWLKNVLQVKGKLSLAQITVDDFISGIKFAELNEYLFINSYRILRNLNIDYFENKHFNVEEKMMSAGPFGKKKAIHCYQDTTAYVLCPICQSLQPTFLGECVISPETFSGDYIANELITNGKFSMGRDDYLKLIVDHRGQRAAGKFYFISSDKDIFFRMGKRVRRTGVD